MRILFLTPASPLPPDAGNKTLAAGLLRHLQREHECDLVAVEAPWRDPAEVERTVRAGLRDLRRVAVFPTISGQRWRLAQAAALARIEQPALARFWSPRLGRCLPDIAARGAYDIVHFDTVRMAPYRRLCAGLPSLLVGSDSYSLSQRRARLARPQPRLAVGNMLQEALFRRYERLEYPHFGMVAVVGEDDARHLREIQPGLDVRVIGIPLPAPFQTAPIRGFNMSPGTARILVTGSMSDLGVANGIGHFLEESSAYMNGAPYGSVTLLGVNPHPHLVAKMRRLAYVQHIDFVDDYAAFLSQDWVYVYPQKCGTGLQTKLQQAMAVGLPAVGYQLSFGALGIQSGTHSFACCTADELHRSVRRLLGDADLRRTIGTAAAGHMRERFSVEAVGQSVVALYAEVVARGE